MQYQKKIRELIQEMSTKANVPFNRMEEICMSPLEFTEHVIHHKVDRSKLHYPSIRIVGFGVFYCKRSKLAMIENLNNKHIYKLLVDEHKEDTNIKEVE